MENATLDIKRRTDAKISPLSLSEMALLKSSKSEHSCSSLLEEEQYWQRSWKIVGRGRKGKKVGWTVIVFLCLVRPIQKFQKKEINTQVEGISAHISLMQKQTQKD